MRKVRTAVIGVGYLGRFHAQKYAALPNASPQVAERPQQIDEPNPDHAEHLLIPSP